MADTPVLEQLWQHYPENMFLMRVEGPSDFVVEAANPAQSASPGSELVGKALHDFLPKATADAIVGRYQQCLDLAKPIRYAEDVAYYDAAGVERFGHWLTLLVPIHYQSDHITHLFGISQNVTELRRATRSGRSLHLLMLDLDDFKEINDSRGHAAGDAVLKQVAATLEAEVRGVDLVGRYGGDEFIVLLPDTALPEALVVAERLRQAVEMTAGVSVSIGVASNQDGETRLGTLARRADGQLFDAKRKGRNRVAVQQSAE